MINQSILETFIEGLGADGSLSAEDYQKIINFILTNGSPELKPRDLIQLRRGVLADMPILAQGEVGIALDTEDVFVGGLNGNFPVNKGFYKTIKADENEDITTKLNQAFQEMVEGDVFIIPKGDYIITNVIYNPPSKTSLICLATLKASTQSGVAFKIGDDLEQKFNLTIEGLAVEATNSASAWSNNVKGVEIVNVADSNINIRRVFGFETNILTIARNNLGHAYNQYKINRSDGGKKSLRLSVESGGFNNENNFFGGELSFVSQNSLDDSCVLLTIDHDVTHPINSNHFWGVSLEGNLTGLGKAAVISGLYNQIQNCRIESVKPIELTTNSKRNNIVVGFDNYLASPVVDNGLENTIQLPSKLKMGSDKDGVFEIKNVGSGLFKNIISKDPSDITTFTLDAVGTVFSKSRAYFENGLRFATSDLSYNDRGIFVSTGNPNGQIAANTGSICLNINGGAGTTLYVKETGVGNTGWVGK